jgi:hypothetical protein
MLVGRRWVPDFVLYRNDVSWEDGQPVSDDEREKILSVLQESARKRKMTIEIEPDVRR